MSEGEKSGFDQVFEETGSLPEEKTQDQNEQPLVSDVPEKREEEKRDLPPGVRLLLDPKIQLHRMNPRNEAESRESYEYMFSKESIKGLPDGYQASSETIWDDTGYGIHADGYWCWPAGKKFYITSPDGKTTTKEVFFKLSACMSQGYGINRIHKKEEEVITNGIKIDVQYEDGKIIATATLPGIIEETKTINLE